jgi:hypothetical protein
MHFFAEAQNVCRTTQKSTDRTARAAVNRFEAFGTRKTDIEMFILKTFFDSAIFF